MISSKLSDVEKKIYYSTEIVKKKLKSENLTYLRDIYKKSELIDFSQFKHIWNLHLNEINSLNLYIHVPFCVKKCAYCMYPSYKLKTSESKKEYINFLGDFFSRFSSLKTKEILNFYVGGGTPNLLNTSELKIFFSIINKHFIFKNGDFVRTFEFSPSLINVGQILAIKEFGIFNRLSFGIQSFNKTTLEREGRTHFSYDQFKKLYSYLKSKLFEEVDVDLIIGLNDEPGDDSLDNFKKLISHNVDSINVNILQINAKKSSLYTSAAKYYQINSSIIEKMNLIAAKNGYSIESLGADLGAMYIKKRVSRGFSYIQNEFRAASQFSAAPGSIGTIPSILDYQTKMTQEFNVDDLKFSVQKLDFIHTVILSLSQMLMVDEFNFKTFSSMFNIEFTELYEKELKYLESRNIVDWKNNRITWDKLSHIEKHILFGIFYPINELKEIYLSSC